MVVLAFHRSCRRGCLGLWILLVCGIAPAAFGEQDRSAVRDRLARGVQFLASDDLGGRGLGTAGIDRAAEFIRHEMQAAGLTMDSIDGGPFQPFVHTADAVLGDTNWARLETSGGEFELELIDDYAPLAVGGTGKVDAPLVFAGYGITATELEYDDYAGIDAAGKAVIIVRHEPQQGDGNSRFNGTANTPHASFRSKIRNAIDHGASAILFCTGGHETNRQLRDIDRRIASTQRQLDSLSDGESGGGDEHSANERRDRLAGRLAQLDRQRLDAERGLLGFAEAGISNDGARIPVLICSREVINQLLSRSGNPTLDDWEAEVDRTGEPRSFVCGACHIKAEVTIDRDEVPVKNVIGVLEGQGPLAHETVVIGAHYDHLGLGKTDRGGGQVHNGADDNASGTMVLLELARRFATRDEAPARRMVFVAFSAEEKGLLGSAHYVAHPPFPLESTVGMVNFDMVGRVQNNELWVNGVGTGEPFSAWLAEGNARSGFSLNEIPGGSGPSDHASFCDQRIPVVHFFTGMHPEYHRPGDDFELLDLDGMCRICDLAETFLDRLAAHPQRIEFLDTKGPSMPPRERQAARPGVWFGVRVDLDYEEDGLAVAEVLAGSPAEQAGVQRGDIVLGLGEVKIADLAGFQAELSKSRPGDRVVVKIRRAEVDLTVEAVLAAGK